MTRTIKAGSRDQHARELFERRLRRIANRERERTIDAYLRETAPNETTRLYLVPLDLGSALGHFK
jgi:hypothetical protein